MKEMLHQRKEAVLKARRELEVNPEIVQGKYFRVPSIVGLGTGRGFDVANIHLPKDWQKALPRLQSLDPEILQQTFQNLCEERRLPEGKIDFDAKSGLLKTVEIATEPISSLSLFRDAYSTKLSSEYTAKNLLDLNVTVALQEFVVGGYLTYIGKDLRLEKYYGYIRERDSQNLRIPKSIFDSEEPVLSDHQQETVIEKAHNIAGRFGENIEDICLNELGILEYVVLSPEASYHQDKLYSKSDTYGPHNVSDIYKASALHGIVAHFINTALEEQETFDPDFTPSDNPYS